MHHSAPLCTTPTDLISPPAAARILGVLVRAIYRRIESGHLRGWKDATGRLRVSAGDVSGNLVAVKGRASGRRKAGKAVRLRERKEAMQEAARLLGI